jgi:hypothetical protein
MVSPNDMQGHDISLGATLQSSSITRMTFPSSLSRNHQDTSQLWKEGVSEVLSNPNNCHFFFCATSAVSVTLVRRLQRRHHDAETVSGMSIHPVQDEANRKTETLERDAKTSRLWIETSCCSEGEAVLV